MFLEAGNPRMRDTSVNAMKWINAHLNELVSIRFDFGVQCERALIQVQFTVL